MTNRCKEPKASIFVELEPAAVRALLNESYRALKDWGQWEPRHNARGPLRIIVQSGPDTANLGLRVYRIEMRCEQAQALWERSEDLADILEDMPEQGEREDGAALKRAAHALDEAIRNPVPK
jgi:hypothetical protein